MTSSSLLMAALGGLLIGLSASLLMLFNGRIAGICGMIAAATLPGERDRLWRWLFLAGLPAGVLVWHFVSGRPYPRQRARRHCWCWRRASLLASVRRWVAVAPAGMASAALPAGLRARWWQRRCSWRQAR
jgi:hypothetical protein